MLLFGSRARGDETVASDVDVRLVLDPPTPLDPAETQLSYLADFDLDLAIFQALGVLSETAIRTAKTWQDFRPQHRRYVEAVLGA